MSNSSFLKLTKRQIKDELWRRGELEFLCHPVQKEMRDIFYCAEPHSILCWLISRQLGKSSLLAILAMETCLRNKNAVVKLVTDTKDHAKKIFDVIFKEFTETCPEDIKPVRADSGYAYNFTNGSVIQLAGAAGQHYERLRGQKSTLVLIDEAGFCPDLDTMVNSVLLPTTTHTGGKLVLSTTPPKDYDHPFTSFMEKAEMEGLLTVKTIDDNPILTKEQKIAIEKQMGGRDSEQFRREYLCQLIKLSTDSALPEVTEELLSKIVKVWETPPFFHTYESMDLGFDDLTAVLFAYYDFKSDKVIIQDELAFDFKEKNQSIKLLVDGIMSKETLNWNNPLTNELREPEKRVSDVNKIVTNQIRIDSQGKLNFMLARKDDKDSAINNLRVLLASEKIIIDPKCETLIRHLKNVKWNKKRDSFVRSVDNSHYDFVDALIYLVRHIDFKKNPYPSGYGMDFRSGDLFINNSSGFKPTKNNEDVFRAIYGRKK